MDLSLTPFVRTLEDGSTTGYLNGVLGGELHLRFAMTITRRSSMRILSPCCRTIFKTVNVKGAHVESVCRACNGVSSYRYAIIDSPWETTTLKRWCAAALEPHYNPLDAELLASALTDYAHELEHCWTRINGGQYVQDPAWWQEKLCAVAAQMGDCE